jgi:hypothetical protein
MLSIFRNRKPRSRLTVGFYRLGIVLAAPFLAGATVLAALQWQNPTGPLVLELPVGTMAYGFGDNPDNVAKKNHR